MKMKLMILITLQLIVQIGFTQTDPQWIVKNNIGKRGATVVNGHYINNYTNGDPLGLTFVLPTTRYTLFNFDRIQFPIRTDKALAKKDLFVIYEDWTHFNSRQKNVTSYSPALDIFYPYGSLGNLRDSIHNLKSNSSSKIGYIYLSTIYQDDDPPPMVSIRSGHVTQNSPVYQFNTVSPLSLITANHDVVKDIDITLIIRADSLRKGDRLSYNNVRYINSPTQEISGNYFNTSPIFSTTPSYTNVQCSQSNGEIVFNDLITATGIRPPYVYINLRGSANLPVYDPDKPNLNSEAIFKIKRGNQVVDNYQLQESILSSHDPNFIQVLSVCHRGSQKFVKYHIEFVNTGSKTARDLKVEIPFPNTFKRLCIGDIKFNAGGIDYVGAVTSTVKNQKLLFEFPLGAQLSMYSLREPIKSIGYIEFCTSVDPRMNLESYNTVLKLGKVRTFFDGQPYSIVDFIDLPPTYKEPFNTGERKIERCRCKCDRNVKTIIN